MVLQSKQVPNMSRTFPRPKTGKNRYSNADRFKAVLGYIKSGLELRVYARRIGVPRETLRCWVAGKYDVSPKVPFAFRTTKYNTKKIIERGPNASNGNF